MNAMERSAYSLFKAQDFCVPIMSGFSLLVGRLLPAFSGSHVLFLSVNHKQFLLCYDHFCSGRRIQQKVRKIVLIPEYKMKIQNGEQDG